MAANEQLRTHKSQPALLVDLQRFTMWPARDLLIPSSSLFSSLMIFKIVSDSRKDPSAIR